MRARLERKIDGCREYFVRKDRSPDLWASEAYTGKRLFGSVRPAYGGEPCRPRALDARNDSEDPRHGGDLSHGAGRCEGAVAISKARDHCELRCRVRPRRF